MFVKLRFIPILIVCLLGGLLFLSPNLKNESQQNVQAASLNEVNFAASAVQAHLESNPGSIFDQIGQDKTTLFNQTQLRKNRWQATGQIPHSLQETKQASAASHMAPANVSVTVNAAASVSIGDEITYSITVVNENDFPIYDIYVYSYIPEGTTLFDASPGYQFWDLDEDLIYWQGAIFEPGESDTVSFTVLAPLSLGTVVNDGVSAEYLEDLLIDSDYVLVDAASVTTEVVDGGSGGTTPTPTATGISPDPGNIDGIAVSVRGPEAVAPNGQLTYEIVVTNNGIATAQNLYILNFLPADTEFVSISQNVQSEYDIFYDAVAWFVGALDVGSSVTVDFTVLVPDWPGVTIYNSGVLIVYGFDSSGLAFPNQDVMTLISGEAAAGDSEVNLTVSATHQVIAGEDIFEVTIQNSGSTAIEEYFYVDLYIDPPAPIRRGGLDWETAGTIHFPEQGIEWEIDGLEAGGTATLTSQAASTLALPPDDAYSAWSGQLPADVKSVYVYVDSWAENESTNGQIREDNEQDNLAILEFAPSNPIPSTDPNAPTPVPTPTPTRLPTLTPTPGVTPNATPVDNNSGFESEISFRAETHGYGFENWGGTQYPDSGDLDNATMIRMFGAANVCQSGNNAQNCVLSASARQWRTQQLKSMEGGHCYGMAVTSQRFYGTFDSVGQYQNGASSITDLQAGTAVRANITEFAISQSLRPADGSSDQWVWRETGQTPSSILNLIRQRLVNNPNDPYVLGFFQDGKGGHAVTPYAIEDKGEGIFWLYFYDNNWPGQPRYMIINTVRETWVYEFASLNPSQPSDPWSGDARTDSLVLRPTSAHLTSGWACPFCYNSTNVHGASVENESVVFMLMGEGEMMVVNGDQKAVGFDFERQQFVNNVSGAEVQEWIGGLGVEQSPILVLPQQLGGDPYKVYIAGKTVAESVNADLLVAGPGFVAGLSALRINPGEDMLITISPDGTAVSFTASEQGTFSPDFFMALDPLGNSDSYIFGVGGFELDAQKKADVSLNLNSGLLNFSDNDGTADTYEVEILRIADDGTVAYYNNTDIQLGGSSNAALNFGAWDGSGDINGTIDGEEQRFTNNNGNDATTDDMRIFLPITQ